MNEMFGALAAARDTWLSLTTCGLVGAAFGLALRFAPRLDVQRVGTFICLIGLVLVGADLPWLGDWLPQVLFWLMSAVALIAAGAAVTVRNPVYTAIWFALSLLGVSALFLLQGALFLGVATIVVYAGAIIVTFLFVLMLAQPSGHALYDRISWAGFAPAMAVLAATVLVGMLLAALPAFDAPPAPTDVLHEAHVARLGGELFTRHLLAVEIVGTLLLVALVGAISIVKHGETPRRRPA